MPKTLMIGYGNADRQDDGVAWHILARLAQRLGYPIPENPEEPFEMGLDPELLYTLQLTPDLAELLKNVDRVCFIDAHTGNIEEEIQVIDLIAGFQNSPFTHHMTPETLLAFAKTLYSAEPKARLVSVRGYEFGFSRSLSQRTEQLASQAADSVYDWIMSA